MAAGASRWLLKSALVPKQFSSDVFRLLDRKALNTLSLPTNVNLFQLARTRLVYYWLRGFARVAVCVSCQNQMFMGTRELQHRNG